MFGANQLPIHGVSTVTGFHDNELKWFRKYRGVNSEGVNTDQNLTYNLNSYYENNFLSLAGVRYLMYKPKDGEGEILPNPEYLPRAFIVPDYIVVPEEDAVVDTLRSVAFVPGENVILEKEPSLEFTGGPMEESEVVSYEYKGNEIELHCRMERNGFVVMTDNYFPYWHAYNETGKELEIYKADLTFRAVELEKGDHKIVFRYVSKPYITGKYLTISGLLFLILLIIFVNFKKKGEFKLKEGTK